VSQLVECVPNFSEGRRPAVIAAIADEVLHVAGVRLLDVQSDEAHNRCVLTFIGPPEAVKTAALAAARQAVALIDMNTHRGVHPRIGAVDVIPFVPIAGVTMEDCVSLARRLGTELWTELRVPVFFYGAAATTPARIRLPDIRKGDYEGLAAKFADRTWAPDIGDAVPHPTAGATVVGARGPLIAYNVNLTTDDVEVARKVARVVRESSGGLDQIQAIGVRNTRGRAQVSMNLLDFRKMPVHRVFEAVQREARQHGVEIADSELVGLIPLDAVVDVVRSALQLREFDRDQILEARLVG
jgi:glutamate formiminotransferase